MYSFLTCLLVAFVFESRSDNQDTCLDGSQADLSTVSEGLQAVALPRQPSATSSPTPTTFRHSELTGENNTSPVHYARESLPSPASRPVALQGTNGWSPTDLDDRLSQQQPSPPVGATHRTSSASTGVSETSNWPLVGESEAALLRHFVVTLSQWVSLLPIPTMPIWSKRPDFEISSTTVILKDVSQPPLSNAPLLLHLFSKQYLRLLQGT